MPILVTNKDKVYGSVIYEEIGTDDMILEFFTSSIGAKIDKDNFDYP